jgi:hypothetical protein
MIISEINGIEFSNSKIGELTGNGLQVLRRLDARSHSDINFKLVLPEQQDDPQHL